MELHQTSDGFGGELKFTTAASICKGDPHHYPLRSVGLLEIPNKLLSFQNSLQSSTLQTLCGTSDSATATSISAKAENGVAYRIVLVVIDPAGNPLPLDLGVATPEPAIDFWEEYKSQGGEAEGGFCFVATAAYDDYDHPYVKVLRDFRDQTLAKTSAGRGFIAWYYSEGPGWADFLRRHPVARAGAAVALLPLVGVAAWWEYLSIPVKFVSLLAIGFFIAWFRSRRRKVKTATVAAGVLVMLFFVFSNVAHAQTYWNEDEILAEASEDDFRATWNIELKFGPYYPDIDKDVSDGSPFRDIHGGKNMFMTKVDIDKFFFYPLGQLGVTGSIGYSTRSSNALKQDENGMATGEKSTDSTGFRIVPASIGVVYRFTALDEHLGIPLVPYGKAALAYAAWWATAPDGNIARAANDGMCDVSDPSCSTSRARGGTLGFAGTVGIAIRAERIDQDARMSLQNELGIEHAGFFVELAYAKIDGFGKSTKLNLSDITWFGGINFEF